MTFNPTTNRIPFGLMKHHERIALEKWPHGWQWYSNMLDRWVDTNAPDGMMSSIVYRGKPAPQEDM